jgi:ATP-dependent Clp protease ATP-binding subunit ClpC
LNVISMFERYTDSAKRALFFARYECSQLGSVELGSDHLLLGLIQDARGIVQKVLSTAGIASDDLRRDVEGRTALREKVSTSVEIPFDGEAKRALINAAEEADRFRHTYIDTEHLLLGLLREEGSIAGSILVARGLRLEEARNQVLKLIEELPHPPGPRFGVELQTIDVIKQFVEQLAMLPPGPRAEALRDHILERLDQLGRSLGE